MRIAELSRRAGVPVPTIKYYLREGLLSPGTPTGRNQATYDEHHLGRLRLIRALREVGGLRIAAAKEVLGALDEPDSDRHELMGRAHRAILPRTAATGTADGNARGDATAGNDDRPADSEASGGTGNTDARAEATRWVGCLGWWVEPGNPALDQLAEVLAALRAVDRDDLLALLPVYAAAALTVARQEVALADAAESPEQVVYSVVTGTVLGETLLSTLRLLAHEHVSATTAPGEAPGEAPNEATGEAPGVSEEDPRAGR